MVADRIDWRFYLLGRIKAECDGVEIELPPYRCRHVLVYLLLKGEHPVRRERLLGDLYPDLPPSKARRRLSDHLWLIRSHLPGLQIDSSGDEVQIISPQVWVDCLVFSEGIHGNEIVAMAAAVNVYKGNFAPDLYGDWVLLARERYRNLYINALLELAVRYEKLGQYLRSSELLERHLLEEPFDEAAVRQLMQDYVRLGRRGLAISTYEKYRLVWIEQLGVEPECETQILYESILARTTLPKISAGQFLSTNLDPRSLIQRAEIAMHEGDRLQMLTLLRDLALVQDPELALRRDLLFIDEAILWNDVARAWEILDTIDQDSAYIELYRAKLYLAGNDLERAFQALADTLHFANNNNNRELEILSLIHISRVKMLRGQLMDAFLTIARSIQLLLNMDRPGLLVQAYLRKGEILYRQGAHRDAREVLFQAQILAETHNFNCLKAEINFWIGNSLYRSGSHLSAYKMLNQALETARDVGLKKLEGQILLGMTAVSDFLGHYQETMQFLNSARAIYLELHDALGLAKVDYNLAAGLPYHDESRCREAIQYAQSALDVFVETGRKDLQAVAHTALAFALWLDAHPREAIIHYQNSLELHLLLGEQNYIPELYAYIGLAYLDIGDLHAGLEWTERACYEQSMRNHSDIVVDIYYARGLAFEKAGNRANAEKFFARAYQILLDFSQDIEDETARQAYFYRDPVARRLMKKVEEVGISPQQRQIVINRVLPGSTSAKVEISLSVDKGAPDQAFAQGKGETALRRVQLQRLLSQADSRHVRLTLTEMARALNVSKRTVQRDLKLLRSDDRL